MNACKTWSNFQEHKVYRFIYKYYMCSYPFQFITMKCVQNKIFFLINVHSTCMWTPFIFIEFFLCTSTCKSVQIYIKKGYSLVDQRETNSNIRWQMIFIQQLMCYPFLSSFLFTNLIQFQCKFLFKNDIFKMFHRH